MLFWIFPLVPCHAFYLWHWPIGKDIDLDLSLIRGHHHLHSVGLWISVDQLITSQPATSCSRHPTRSKQLSTVAILGFQFGLYHVVAPLSFIVCYCVSSGSDELNGSFCCDSCFFHIIDFYSSFLGKEMHRDNISSFRCMISNRLFVSLAYFQFD